jgi:hypothetical protein
MSFGNRTKPKDSENVARAIFSGVQERGKLATDSSIVGNSALGRMAITKEMLEKPYGMTRQHVTQIKGILTAEAQKAKEVAVASKKKKLRKGTYHRIVEALIPSTRLTAQYQAEYLMFHTFFAPKLNQAFNNKISNFNNIDPSKPLLQQMDKFFEPLVVTGTGTTMKSTPIVFKGTTIYQWRTASKSDGDLKDMNDIGFQKYIYYKNQPTETLKIPTEELDILSNLLKFLKSMARAARFAECSPSMQKRLVWFGLVNTMFEKDPTIRVSEERLKRITGGSTSDCAYKNNVADSILMVSRFLKVDETRITEKKAEADKLSSVFAALDRENKIEFYQNPSLKTAELWGSTTDKVTDVDLLIVTRESKDNGDDYVSKFVDDNPNLTKGRSGALAPLDKESVKNGMGNWSNIFDEDYKSLLYDVDSILTSLRQNYRYNKDKVVRNRDNHNIVLKMDLDRMEFLIMTHGNTMMLTRYNMSAVKKLLTPVVKWTDDDKVKALMKKEKIEAKDDIGTPVLDSVVYDARLASGGAQTLKLWFGHNILKAYYLFTYMSASVESFYQHGFDKSERSITYSTKLSKIVMSAVQEDKMLMLDTNTQATTAFLSKAEKMLKDVRTKNKVTTYFAKALSNPVPMDYAEAGDEGVKPEIKMWPSFLQEKASMSPEERMISLSQEDVHKRKINFLRRLYISFFGVPEEVKVRDITALMKIAIARLSQYEDTALTDFLKIKHMKKAEEWEKFGQNSFPVSVAKFGVIVENFKPLLKLYNTVRPVIDLNDGIEFFEGKVFKDGDKKLMILPCAFGFLDYDKEKPYRALNTTEFWTTIEDCTVTLDTQRFFQQKIETPLATIDPSSFTGSLSSISSTATGTPVI